MPPRSRGRRRLLLAFAIVLATIAGGLLVRGLAVGSVVVDSLSMAPTLHVGQRLVVNRLAYGPPAILAGVLPRRLPARGDIVMFVVDDGGASARYVKRVVGLPGDVVEVRDRHLSVNGRPAIARPSAELLVLDDHGQPAPDWPADLFHAFSAFAESLDGHDYRAMLAAKRGPGVHSDGAWTVEAGELFVLGDNRDDSRDSRAPIAEGGLGPIPIDHVLGRIERAERP